MLASLIVNIPAKQIETNVCGKYWIAKIFRELVNDQCTICQVFSNNTCNYSETTEDLSPCMYVGGLANYGAC